MTSRSVCPPQFAFFGRAVGMLAGLTAALTPNFNFLEVATPHAKKLISEFGGGGILGMLGATSLEDLAQNSLREGLALFRSLTRLPRQLDRLIEKADRGELRIIIEPTIDAQRGRGRRGRGRGRGRGSPSSSALETLNRPIPLWAPLGMAGVAGVWALVSFMRGRRHRHRR